VGEERPVGGRGLLQVAVAAHTLVHQLLLLLLLLDRVLLLLLLPLLVIEAGRCGCGGGGGGRGMVEARGGRPALLALVDAHVAVEVARLREAQLAQLALVGLLARVHAHVLRQRGRVRERFAAVLAAAKGSNG